MDEQNHKRMMRLVLDNFIWYDVEVYESFDFYAFISSCQNQVYFKNNEIELFIPTPIKTAFVWRVNKPATLNIVNFPGQPPCEPPKAS